MANRRLNRIKGQLDNYSEEKESYLRSKYGIPSICSNGRMGPPCMPYNQSDPSTHAEAVNFFAQLQKTCKNNE